MAEFKLGRLRFVWKNSWTATTQYYQDDVIFYGGKLYICVIGHISAESFYTDFDINPSKWNIVSEGQTWKADWQPQTFYNISDIVKYGGKLYICQTQHTSAEDSTTGLEPDIDKWQIYAEGLEWKNNWSTSFDYKENDLVKYGGTTYVCNTAHISAGTESLGLENDQEKWDIFNQGFDYKGSWTVGSRYKLNDVVRNGGNLWIAVSYHTSSDNFQTDVSNWNKFIDGFQYEARWNPDATYQQGDIVAYGGNQYLAKTTNTATRPSTNENDWDLFSEGIRFLGDWGDDSSNFEYEPGDLVRLGGYTYRATVDHSGQQPPNTDYWERFNTGLSWRGEWLDDQEYFLGDIVRYESNTYVCILGHISEGDDYSTETSIDPGGGAENSRPDLDTNGTYWNLLSIGSEQSVLTTTGDLLYYSNSGPARLPIGTNGQILQVSSSGFPNWTTLNSADDVYYVAEHGVDSPAPEYGKTIDRPWRSIRYATEQIEKGTKVPKAVKLLELNRRFIQREIVEWTDWQIANNQSPFTTTFSYDSAKCERDMGFLIDAFIYDLSHGGNQRSRRAALKYVNSPGNFYNLGQEAETIASIQYGLTLIEKVLKQEPPAINYQVTNGDNSTAIVEQYFDSSIVGDQSIVEYESTVTNGIATTVSGGS